MDKLKVLQTLGDWTADPFYAQTCMKIIEFIDEDRPFGRIILRIIRFAEQGAFK